MNLLQAFTKKIMKEIEKAIPEGETIKNVIAKFDTSLKIQQAVAVCESGEKYDVTDALKKKNKQL